MLPALKAFRGWINDVMVLLITTEIYLILSKHNFSTLVAKFGGEQMGKIISTNMIQLQIRASLVSDISLEPKDCGV